MASLEFTKEVCERVIQSPEYRKVLQKKLDIDVVLKARHYLDPSHVLGNLVDSYCEKGCEMLNPNGEFYKKIKADYINRLKVNQGCKITEENDNDL